MLKPCVVRCGKSGRCYPFCRDWDARQIARLDLSGGQDNSPCRNERHTAIAYEDSFMTQHEFCLSEEQSLRAGCYHEVGHFVVAHLLLDDHEGIRSVYFNRENGGRTEGIPLQGIPKEEDLLFSSAGEAVERLTQPEVCEEVIRYHAQSDRCRLNERQYEEFLSKNEEFFKNYLALVDDLARRMMGSQQIGDPDYYSLTKQIGFQDYRDVLENQKDEMRSKALKIYPTP